MTEEIRQHYYRGLRVNPMAQREAALKRAEEGKPSVLHRHTHGEPCSYLCEKIEP